ncbi:MAG TPA: YegP family protein [Candidatus Paceibacterota bacterium]|nr:YegP family protein [Candidatus Paceibacterota bacterium]HQB57096.1 YegP family protein [Candidatus Paceibacterota bacterium]
MATYQIHKDNKGEYYWTLRSDKNYKTIAMSSESYDSKQGAKDSIEWTRNNAKGATLEDLT